MGAKKRNDECPCAGGIICRVPRKQLCTPSKSSLQPCRFSRRPSSRWRSPSRSPIRAGFCRNQLSATANAPLKHPPLSARDAGGRGENRRSPSSWGKSPPIGAMIAQFSCRVNGKTPASRTSKSTESIPFFRCNSLFLPDSHIAPTRRTAPEMV